jgi:hypothetical protein
MFSIQLARLFYVHLLHWPCENTFHTFPNGELVKRIFMKGPSANGCVDTNISTSLMICGEMTG